MAETTPSGNAVDTATTWLFVPGSRADRFARALETGADQVVIDLEDAVAADAKEATRGSVARFLEQHEPPLDRLVVRINGCGTPWHDPDLELVSRFGCAVMLPKASSKDMVDAVAGRARSGIVIGLIETAAGVLSAAEVAAAAARVAFGNVDLAAELGMDPADRAALAPMRAAVVLGSSAAGRPAPVDGVTIDLLSPEVSEADARAAVRHGFGGKLCVHPSQVAPVRAGFRPTEEEVAWAARILDDGEAGASQVGGQMVDAPVLARARAIIQRRDRASDM